MWRKVFVAVAILWGLPGISTAEEAHVLYNLVTKSATSAAIASDTVLWTPASGKRIAVMGCAVSSGGAQQTLLELNNEPVLPRIYTAADTNYQTAVGSTPLRVGATDETLTYTTSSTTTTTIVCTGYEYQG